MIAERWTTFEHRDMNICEWTMAIQILFESLILAQDERWRRA